jgi:UDP-N-acetylmuramate dehydrogenase
MSESLAVQQDVPLAPLTTLEIGGPARYYRYASDRATVRAAVRWVADRGLPLLVLGGGSNLVVADEGFPGLALHLGLQGRTAAERDGALELTAGAGEDWDPLVAEAVAGGWAGLECLSGIPGRVGATPIQNVGAYGQDVAETVSRVEALDLATGAVTGLSNAECRFGYRHSRFKREDRGRYVILSVTYRLRRDGQPAVRYPELERALGGRRAPTLREVRDAVLEIRRRKSMVLDPRDPNRRSVGSFFVNPVVPEALAGRIRDTVRQEGADAERMPAFPAGEGRVKLSAAWLIERAGLARGHRRGRVGISTNHTLAIVNAGGATARDVVALAREIRDRVRDRFGVTLVPEPVFVNLEW